MKKPRVGAAVSDRKSNAIRARRPDQKSVGRTITEREPHAAMTPTVIPYVSHAIRVLCVDDHAVLVEGIKAHFAIDGGIEVVGRLSTATRLVEEVERLHPNVVLLDIEMPGPDAFEMADRLHHSHPEVRIMMLSAHVRDGFISASFKSGASAYFSKSDELEDITRGIHELMPRSFSGFVLGPRVRERASRSGLGRGGTSRRRGATNHP